MSRLDVIQTVACVAFAALLAGAMVLLRDPNALRDSSTESRKPFSFARVQMLWWTLLIVGSYIASYGLTGRLLEMSSTCLTLLGISAGTTAGARMIDKDQERTTGTRHQDEPSTGFFTDILSDENGISVHRFQAVVLNLFIGFTFVIDIFCHLDDKAFPTLDGYMLALLGVSSGTYVTVKTMENRPQPEAALQPAASETSASDELLDPIGTIATENH
jgi:hypothetical protein